VTMYGPQQQGDGDATAPRRPGRGPVPHGTVTLTDVARHVGLSAQSVSNALHNPTRVAPATRDRILAAVEELGYRPNRSARGLRSQRSGLIGIRVAASPDDRAALLLDQFLHALAEAARPAGHHLILCQADDEDEEIAAYRELLDTTSVDAFVLHTMLKEGDRRIDTLRAWGVPFATFGRAWDGDPDHVFVDVDGRAGIRMATEHLVAEGHRRVAYIGWSMDSAIARDRLAGWLDACAVHDLDTRRVLAVADDFEAGRESAHELLDDPDPATAIVCASDTLALGVMRALGERGLRAGSEVAVTGFDNSPAAALTTPGLTSLRQPIVEVAHDLIGAVEDLLAGVPTRRQTVVLPELIVRQSSLRGPSSPIKSEETR
jgi:DNA-binding LacI/PurR family transcriptional regulator